MHRESSDKLFLTISRGVHLTEGEGNATLSTDTGSMKTLSEYFGLLLDAGIFDCGKSGKSNDWRA